jgi:hypothetical protein
MYSKFVCFLGKRNINSCTVRVGRNVFWQFEDLSVLAEDVPRWSEYLSRQVEDVSGDSGQVEDAPGQVKDVPGQSNVNLSR